MNNLLVSVTCVRLRLIVCWAWANFLGALRLQKWEITRAKSPRRQVRNHRFFTFAPLRLCARNSGFIFFATFVLFVVNCFPSCLCAQEPLRAGTIFSATQ